MGVNLSIKNVPDELAARLRRRAARNHRSLQGELMAIIGAAVPEGTLTPSEFLAEIRRIGIRTESDGADIIRADRDRDNDR